MTAENKIQARPVKLDLFRGLSEDAIKTCISLGESQTRQPGGFFFHEGESPSGLYLLRGGRVKVYQSTARGREALLHIISPGGAFGLRSLLSVCSRARASSALALEESRALVWDRITMIRLIESNQQFARNLHWMAVCQLDELQETYFYLGTQPAKRRVAWVLALLAGKMGRKTDDGLVVLENVSVRVLADLAGTAIHTVNRILRGWERDNALTKCRGQIVVRQPGRLAELAESLD